MAFAVTLETNELGTKSKLDESLPFAPVNKDSDEYKEFERKYRNENAVEVFQDSSGAIEKEICKDIFKRSKDAG